MFWKVSQNPQNNCARVSFKKVGGLRSATLLKRKLTQVFFYKFCKIFKNKFFTEHLWVTAPPLQGSTSETLAISGLRKTSLWKPIIDKIDLPFLPYRLSQELSKNNRIKFTWVFNSNQSAMFWKEYPLTEYWNLLWNVKITIVQLSLSTFNFQVFFHLRKNFVGFMENFVVFSFRNFSVALGLNNWIGSTSLRTQTYLEKEEINLFYD